MASSSMSSNAQEVWEIELESGNILHRGTLDQIPDRYSHLFVRRLGPATTATGELVPGEWRYQYMPEREDEEVAHEYLEEDLTDRDAEGDSDDGLEHSLASAAGPPPVAGPLVAAGPSSAAAAGPSSAFTGPSMAPANALPAPVAGPETFRLELIYPDVPITTTEIFTFFPNLMTDPGCVDRLCRGGWFQKTITVAMNAVRFWPASINQKCGRGKTVGQQIGAMKRFEGVNEWSETKYKQRANRSPPVANYGPAQFWVTASAGRKDDPLISTLGRNVKAFPHGNGEAGLITLVYWLVQEDPRLDRRLSALHTLVTRFNLVVPVFDAAADLRSRQRWDMVASRFTARSLR